MITRFPLWKAAAIACALVFGGLYGLPNAFPDDPAIQVSGVRSSVAVSVDALQDVAAELTAAGHTVVGVEEANGQGLIRLA